MKKHRRCRRSRLSGLLYLGTAPMVLALPGIIRADVVINEIHYHPEPKSELVEFVELHNSGDTEVDLGGWTFSEAFNYTFPDGTLLEPNAYLVLAQNKEHYNRKFGSIFVSGAPAFDQFSSGALDNSGEIVVLANAGGEIMDRVDYGFGFPWPTSAGGEGASMELVNPSLENDLGGSWRSSENPTPGDPNSVFSEVHPPQIRKVNHSLEQVTSDDAVVISAKVTDPDGVSSVTLLYQIVKPGDYIELTDDRYETAWTEIAMADDGSGADTVAADDVYTAEMPADLHDHRHLVRYRIVAEDGSGASGRAPLEDDPQPNFAYFIYDEMPSWNGATEPGADDPVTYNSDLLQSIPVYHLITTRDSHVEAQHIPNSSRGSGYTGSDYLWRGTLVYDGDVYDHVSFRARGGVWRYAMGKNMWKFAFERGHRFQARDQEGKKFSQPWRRLNFSAIIQQGNFQHRGEQGLFESVGFDLFNMAGVEAPHTYYVHFRIIENARESNIFGNQYGTDLQGLYLVTEQMDGPFLEANDLPDGNLYKMENGTGVGNIGGELKNQGAFPEVDDSSDLIEFKRHYERESPDEDWWKANLDLDRYYSYRSIVEGIHHYDIGNGKNYYYYHNRDTGKWQVHPWDLDLTWDDGMFGNGNEPFKSRVLGKDEFQGDYENRLRHLRDLLYNEEQVGMLIDEKAAVVYTPGEPSWVDADRAMWDYNPIMTSRYVNSSKSGQGRFYRIATTDDFSGMIERLKNYVRTQSTWIDDSLLDNESIVPRPPEVTASGDPLFPVDDLRFTSSAFSGGSIFSPQEFAAMQWRIAEVTDPADPSYTSAGPHNYEIDADWESEPITTFEEEIRIPLNVARPDRTYRVRVRMLNDGGFWSSWSPPVQFITTEPDLGAYRDGLVISEIMYHPREATAEETKAGFTGSDFEFIELVNVGATALDLTPLRFTKGIDFDFEGQAMLALEPGAVALVVRDAAAAEMRYGSGLPLVGEYKSSDGEDKLSNDGELLKLSYGAGLSIREVEYDDGPPWPAAADGAGPSLELIDAQSAPDPSLAASWRSSSDDDGTPGRLPSDPGGQDYASWQTLHFDESELNQPAISGPQADPDHDGWENFLEFSFVGDPRSGDNPGPVVSADPATEAAVLFEFRRNPAATQLDYSIQAAPDLIQWENISPDMGDLVETRPVDDGAVVEVWRVTQDETVSFLRLAVTSPQGAD